MKGNGIVKSIFFVAIVILSIFCIVCTQSTMAANLKDWKSEVASYTSGFGFKVKYGATGDYIYEERWLLYDTTNNSNTYEDIYCVRSGDRQGNSYTEIDLYNLSNEQKNILFSSEDDYKHFMWVVENMFLYGDDTTNLETYAKNVLKTNLPYSSDDLMSNKLFIKGEKTGNTYSQKRNQQLTKVIQNEILLQLVKQTKDRHVDLANMYKSKYVNSSNVGTKADDKVQSYYQKVMDYLYESDTWKNYNINNKNKNFGTTSYDGYVKIANQKNTDNEIIYTVNNKYKAKVNNIKIFVNDVQLNSNYVIYNLNNVDVTSKIKDNLTNSATDKYQFKVEYDNMSDGDVVKVELDVDYGYITKATLLKPNEDVTKGRNNQYMINVSKYNQKDTVSTEGEVEIEKIFDLALTKQITWVDDYQLERLKTIDTSGIKRNIWGIRENNTARYMMNKSSEKVKEDSVVTYMITIYNEGELDGYAQQVTDYLPEGLEFLEDNLINDEYGWVATKNDDGSTTVTTDYLSKEKSVDNIILAYDGSTLHAKTLELQCRVTPTTEMLEKLNDKNNDECIYFDNRAEISIYGYTNKSGDFIVSDKKDIDIDSIQNSVKNDSEQTEISGFLDLIENIFKELRLPQMYMNKALVSYEDDDDVERLHLVKENTKFDLALRKWIVVDEEDSRAPTTYIEEELNASLYSNCLIEGTLKYDNPKDAIEVKKGDIITYRIGIFNEGDRISYAEEITDYLPAGLELAPNSEVNEKYGWYVDNTVEGLPEGVTAVKTNYLARFNKEGKEQETEMDIADGTSQKTDIIAEGATINQNAIMNLLLYGALKGAHAGEIANIDDMIACYRTVDIQCIVSDEALEAQVLTNRAEITKYGYYTSESPDSFVEVNATDIDEDSVEDTIKESLDLDKWYYTYYDPTNIDVNYPGVEDDDDFETVKLELTGNYNLAIRKVAVDRSGNLTNEVVEGVTFTVLGKNNSVLIDENNPTNEDGIVKVANNINISETGIDTYKITEIKTKDGYIPFETFGIELTVTKQIDEVGIKYIVADAQITPKYLENWTNAAIETDSSKLTKEQLKELQLISKAKVNLNKETQTITITIPNREIGIFDLALRKYITKVDETEYTNRIPKFEIKDGKYTYTHTKEAVDVYTSNIVTYTIRVYNEGTRAGYASKIMDDIPEGLKFVPATYNDEGNPTNTNAKYGWVAYKEASEDDEINELNSIKYNEKTYVITDKTEEAELIVTDYLSQEEERTEGENLLLPFDEETMEEPYSKTVEVAFEVTEPNTSDRVIINKAQITEDKDENSEDVEDEDSTPNRWIETDDDQDIEKIKVKYFDLELRKWVTQAIVIENGKEKVTETGHKAEDNPEKTVLVEIGNRDINDVTVKFKYSIRITNKGEIPGYATEISDYIPKGLKFVKEDNPDWKEVDGKVVTDKLKDTLLQPEETAEVEIILTWINGENNFGEKVNTAEISKDYNKYGTPDIDSTPNNLVEDEDDIDNAPVKLTIKTGEVITYTGLAIAVLSILAGGIISIKKFVLV